MASFPEISARNYSVHRGPHSLVQEPVLIPRFQFQYTSNFDFYLLGKCDFIPLEHPPHHYAVLHSDIAICLWESLKMKVRYILATSRNGNCDAVFDLLSTYIPSAKLQEIDMLPPPFPSIHQLTFNPFLRPGHPAVIESIVSSWQTTSRMLSAWIAKAQENSVRRSSCSWSWPPSSVGSLSPVDSPSDSESTDISSTAPELESVPNLGSTPASPVARSFHAQVDPTSLKRVRDSSPIDPRRDGDEAHKKQLVLWRPSLSQLLEAQQVITTGEVPSGSSISSIPHAPPGSPSSTLNPRLHLDDPRLQTTSSVQARHTLANSLARLQRLQQLVHGSSAN